VKHTVRESHAQLSTMLLSNETSADPTDQKTDQTSSPKSELPDSRNDPVVVVLVLDICERSIVFSELQDCQDNLTRSAGDVGGETKRQTEEASPS